MVFVWVLRFAVLKRLLGPRGAGDERRPEGRKGRKEANNEGREGGVKGKRGCGVRTRTAIPNCRRGSRIE